MFGSWSLGCSRLLLAAPAVRLLGLLLAASLLLACCWLLVADGCCCSSREQPIRQATQACMACPLYLKGPTASKEQY